MPNAERTAAAAGSAAAAAPAQVGSRWLAEELEEKEGTPGVKESCLETAASVSVVAAAVARGITMQGMAPPEAAAPWSVGAGGRVLDKGGGSGSAILVLALAAAAEGGAEGSPTRSVPA